MTSDRLQFTVQWPELSVGKMAMGIQNVQVRKNVGARIFSSPTWLVAGSEVF